MFRILICVLALSLSAPVFSSEDPVSLIRESTTELFNLVDQNRSEYEQAPALLHQKLKEVLGPRLDQLYSARLVLGRHSRQLEREQIEAFSDALTNVLMRRYASGLLEFKSRNQVEILPLAGENTERMTRVRTRIALESGSQAPVDYILRRRGDEWLVFDVIVEGISYVSTLRNQINEEIRRDGFDSMMERLQRGEFDIEVDASDNAG